MDDLKFNSLEELYKKILPALRTKVNELKRNNISYIKEEDIWNYLKNNFWRNKTDLTLGQMVDDIINASNSALEKYKKDMILNNPYNN